jgi:hypothetical protein
MPNLKDPVNWIPIRGKVFPNEPGVEGFTPWYSLNNTTAYKYYMIIIYDRYGNANYCKVSEVQAQILPQSSTINYDTANVVIDYGNTGPPASGSQITATFYADNLTPDQQLLVQNFILDTNHFTTQFTYSSVRMVRADLDISVYYNPAYGRNTVMNNVSKALQNLLIIKKGSISRTRKFSDLMGCVLSVAGVDYCIFNNPPNGQDIECATDQYVYLTSLAIEMVLTDRT